jgi:amino acid adenylation domain-containing protein
MSAMQFFNRLRDLNIALWLEGDRLRFRAPAGGLTDDIRAELTGRKPELIALLRQLSARPDADPPLVRADRPGRIAPTLAQQRLWFLDRLQPGVPAYNIYNVLEIAVEVDVPALRRSLNELVRRHEILRTCFPTVDGIPIQRIAPPTEVALVVVDLSAMPEAEQVAEVRARALQEAKTPFDLARGPLLRVGLIRLAQARYVWLLSVHHIVSDDGSMRLLYRELDALYRAYSRGLPSPLPELPIQWADFTLWQETRLQGKALDSLVEYWATQLSGELPTLNLPTDRPRRQPARGRNGKFSLGRSLAADLRSLSASEGVTSFITAIAAYAALLARLTGQDDFIIGAPISDRRRVETEGLIGFFLNTLPLRIRVDTGARFRDLLRQVKEICLGAYSHQDVPYESMLRHLEIDRDSSGNSLFQTMLVFHDPGPALHEPSLLWGVGVVWGEADAASVADEAYCTEPGNDTTKFDLAITMVEHSDGIRGKVEYNADLFDEATMAGLIEEYRCLLTSVSADPDCRIRDLTLMTPGQRVALLEHWSRGPRRSGAITCLHELFEHYARVQPSAVAVEDEHGALTYGELNAQANQLAHRLRARGISSETKVGVFLERSRRFFVAVLSVLKAGGAYVPLDPAYPVERLDLIIEDAGISCLLSVESMAATLRSRPPQTLDLERDAVEISAASRLDPPQAAVSENLACVLYTSGSTGRPKGVLLTHRALVNFIEGAIRDCGLSSSDRILQFHSVGADSSVEETFITLSAGATLVLRSDRMLDSLPGFVEHCRRARLTTLVIPTAYWHELVSILGAVELPASLRRIIIGGERASPEKLAQWQRTAAARIDLINAYGPTEGAIAVTRHLCARQATESSAGAEVRIGTPVANASVYLLDRRLQPVPPGVLGEIYLGGAGVARGYLNQAGLTAERFVPDPFAAVAGARLYRTGDLGRFLFDGTLEYRGRLDNQIKIRGFRVEPREIEVILQELEVIRSVVVIAREDHPGDRQLVAYVVAHPGKRVEVSALYALLKRKLPLYMLPAAFVVLADLPLNVNGKVDHRALPAPNASRTEAMLDPEREQARTPTELKVAAIWRQVLKLERVGAEEDFFELGGHSLLATQVIVRVNAAFDIDLPLRRIFEAPTIAELSRIIDELSSDVPLSINTGVEALLDAAATS